MTLLKYFRDMKSLNINELRELISDAHKKLLLRATKDDLEEAKKQMKEEMTS